jgi:hypothetical protein
MCCLLLLYLSGCQEETLNINKIGSFRFRRSYADIQFREMPSREIDSIRFSNPVIEWGSFSKTESELIVELKLTKVLDNVFDLNRNKFPDTVEKKIILTHIDGRTVELRFLPVSNKESHTYDLVVTNDKQKAIFRLKEQYNALNRDISYLLLDLIPGGYPEIVILNEYYIMNGDNSDLYIYEITD